MRERACAAEVTSKYASVTILNLNVDNVTLKMTFWL